MKITTYKPELDEFFDFRPVKYIHYKGIEVSKDLQNELNNLLKYCNIPADYFDSFIFIIELIKITFQSVGKPPETVKEFQKEKSLFYNYLKDYSEGKIQIQNISFKGRTKGQILNMKTSIYLDEIMRVLLSEFNQERYEHDNLRGATKDIRMHAIAPLIIRLNEFLLRNNKRKRFIKELLVLCDIWEPGVSTKTVEHWLNWKYSPDIDVRIL